MYIEQISGGFKISLKLSIQGPQYSEENLVVRNSGTKITERLSFSDSIINVIHAPVS